jgi:hypothetical protein
MAYSYPGSHCNTEPHAYTRAHGDTQTDVNPATYINPAPVAHATTHAGTHSDPATRDSLRLRQHRGGPLLRGEEERIRRLLGLG